MKKIKSCLSRCYSSGILLLWHVSLFANNIPTTPINLSGGDPGKSIGNYILTGLGYLCYLVAIGAFVVVGGAVMGAYSEARQKENLKHFFTWAAIGVIVLVIVLALVYEGYELTSQSF